MAGLNRSGSKLSRRSVLGLSVAGLAVAASPRRPAGEPRPARCFLVPGYEPDAAYRHGHPLRFDQTAARALPEGYAGPVTMVSRIDARTGETRRALMPIIGHAIAPDASGDSALWVSMNGDVALRFAVETLDVIQAITPHRDGFAFGGHAVFAAERGVVFVAERRDPTMRYVGSAPPHHGRISVRDVATLAVLDAWDCQGIAPHDLTLTPDRRHLVVANYGSTAWPEGREAPVQGVDYGVEPCVTVLDAGTGELVAKIPGTQRMAEVRHVAALGLGAILALQVRPTSFEDAQRTLFAADAVYEPDASEREGLGYLPVPMLMGDASSGAGLASRPLEADTLRTIRAQSIVADPAHDEFIATFTSSNTVGVIGADGIVRRWIATDRLGLRWPRGIALLPDGVHYAVSGDWSNVFVFRRGSHELRREASSYETLFGHSHLAVA